MTTKKRGLGRGLDALLGTGNASSQENPGRAKKRSCRRSCDQPGSGRRVLGSQAIAGDENNSLKYLPVEFIQPGKYQPRLDMRPESLEELANSIKAQGVMQPIVVRSISSDMYEIVAGERRWRASQLAGLDKIPVIIKQVADEAAIAMALIENIQRENLNPIEEAMALQRLD